MKVTVEKAKEAAKEPVIYRGNVSGHIYLKVGENFLNLSTYSVTPWSTMIHNALTPLPVGTKIILEVE